MGKENKVEIGFGTQFEVKGEPDRVDVILNADSADRFQRCQIISQQDQDLLISAPGTGGVSDIERILDQPLTVDQIIEAVERDIGSLLSPDDRRFYQDLSKRPKMEVTLQK